MKRRVMRVKRPFSPDDYYVGGLIVCFALLMIVLGMFISVVIRATA